MEGDLDNGITAWIAGGRERLAQRTFTPRELEKSVIGSITKRGACFQTPSTLLRRFAF
jgi:hypothetical protein